MNGTIGTWQPNWHHGTIHGTMAPWHPGNPDITSPLLCWYDEWNHGTWCHGDGTQQAPWHHSHPYLNIHHCTLAPWHPGILAPWQLGSLATWHPGSLAAWQLGSLAAWQLGFLAPPWPKHHGIMACTMPGTTAASEHHGTTMAPMSPMSPWHHCGTIMPPWNHGIPAFWYPGSIKVPCTITSFQHFVFQCSKVSSWCDPERSHFDITIDNLLGSGRRIYRRLPDKGGQMLPTDELLEAILQ